jgi:hypothetical protein
VSDLISIEKAAADYGICPKRLRGAMYVGDRDGDIRAPVGSIAEGLVYDDWRLAKYVSEKMGKPS